MSREDNTEVNFQMIDKDTHECKVLWVINQLVHIDVDDISKVTNIKQSSINTALRSLLQKPSLCEISKIDGGNTRRKESAAKYRLVKMNMKVSEFTALSNKEKGTPKVKKEKKSLVFIRELSGIAMGDISPASRANGYGIGGICHG